MKLRTVVVPACLLVASFGRAQSAADVACAAVARMAIPAEHRLPAGAAAPEENCGSIDILLGVGEPAQPVAARYCAIAEMERGETDAISGAGVLAMIYANGSGVPRDLDLATRMACLVGGAPDEREGRVLHLVELKRAGWTGNDFHGCDDATSGYLAGRCAALDDRIAEVERNARLAKLRVHWSEAKRSAYDALRTAANAYFDDAESNEVELSGTARAAFQVEARAALEVELLDGLELLEKPEELPYYNGEEAREVDAALNQIYGDVKRAMTGPDWSGTMTWDGVRSTQRAWLKYRDAWTALATLTHPEIPKSTWPAWQSQLRIVRLGSLITEP